MFLSYRAVYSVEQLTAIPTHDACIQSNLLRKLAWNAGHSDPGGTSAQGQRPRGTSGDRWLAWNLRFLRPNRPSRDGSCLAPVPALEPRPGSSALKKALGAENGRFAQFKTLTAPSPARFLLIIEARWRCIIARQGAQWRPFVPRASAVIDSAAQDAKELRENGVWSEQESASRALLPTAPHPGLQPSLPPSLLSPPFSILHLLFRAALAFSLSIILHFPSPFADLHSIPPPSSPSDFSSRSTISKKGVTQHSHHFNSKV